MKRFLALTLTLGLCAAPLSAGELSRAQEALKKMQAQSNTAQGKIPDGVQIINLGMLEALMAIGHADLAGVFAFIPPEQAPMAMADFLFRNRKALRRFVKKCESDYKKAQAVSIWDHHVLLYLVGLISQRTLPRGMKPVRKRWAARVNTLGLVPALPLQIIVQRRGK